MILPVRTWGNKVFLSLFMVAAILSVVVKTYELPHFGAWVMIAFLFFILFVNSMYELTMEHLAAINSALRLIKQRD
jgi:hypothetical protein